MRWARRWRTFLIVTLVAAGLYVVLDEVFDRSLRGTIERRMNRELEGYTAHLEELDFHPLRLALDLERLTVAQNAHPDPPVLHLPRMDFSIHWRALFYGRLVADCEIEDLVLNANLAQLEGENRDDVPLEDRGWQDALESIYPLKINELRVTNATVAYRGTSEFRPLEARNVNLIARNMRNVRSEDRQYPSSLDLDGTVFDVGRVEIHGNADFLAKPTPAFLASIGLERVDLAYFDPILRPYSLSVRQGFLDGFGHFETGPSVEIVDLERVVITDAAIDYAHGAVPPEEVAEVAQQIEESARAVMNDPETLYRIRSLTVENGTIGFINQLEEPSYRLYAENADFELRNLSSRAEDGRAEATLTGTLMGTGRVNAKASFFPEGQNANFEASLEIAETQLQPMNDFLRAHAKLDVVEGVFSLYTYVRVEDGMIDGYVKPMFRDVNVYDPAQDKHKNIFHKMYEGLAGGLARLLENDKRDEVATVASLSGPVSDPRSSALQIIGNLIQNAFIEAILPGFLRDAVHVDREGVARRGPKRKRSAEES